MLMTEQEANEKYCPQTLVGNMPASCCVGSKCAAWRWADRDDIYIPEGSETPEGWVKCGTMATGGKKYDALRLKRKSSDGLTMPRRGSCGLCINQ